MIRPYLNGFTIAFNVSQPSTWQPYVDSMHHFLAGKLLVTPESYWQVVCICAHRHATVQGSPCGHLMNLEREALEMVTGALPFWVGLSNSLDMRMYSESVGMCRS